MIEHRAPGLLNEAPPDEPLADEASMTELRTLLLGTFETHIAEIHARLTDPQRQLKEVSRVLPAAVAVRSRDDDDELTDALSPTGAAALNRSVRKDPQPLVDAIFPVMGPAIRKAIAAALGGMVQSLNQTLAHSFSLQGLKWRVEAWRTSRSFGEVVLLHTLLYRVEQVFLIHRETGLLLLHVVAPGVPAQDADMVSGMLTAIRDFVHDSFSGGQGDQLDALQVGELAVWVEQGPQALVAGLIRGTAPKELRTTYQEALERIHLQFGEALRDFAGDAAPFEAARPLLEDCLAAQFATEGEDAPARRKPTPLLIISGAIILALLLWGFFAWRASRRWDAYVEKLRREPGIVVTEVGARGGKYFVGGLRDPLARSPLELLGETKVALDKVTGEWQPFQALQPGFVLARAKKLLAPPPTVDVAIDGDTLVATGFASQQWIDEARRAARFIPGLSRLEDEQLFDLERIENPLIRFELDRTVIMPGQDEQLRQLAADIERLRSVARVKHQQVRLEITGRTDASGSEAHNTALGQERANVIAAELKARLSEQSDLTIVPVGSKERLREELTEADRATNRSVAFKIILGATQE